MLRFEQEARSASKLSHPNIVTIHEIGEDAGFHFIAQEFVDGVTLRTRLSSGLLPFQSILDIAVQVAAALAAAHKSGIIHRDIKPENLMIRTDGLVKVLDFGIARAIEEGPNREDDWRRVGDSLTTPGMILGTVKYMSPEQARGLPLDHRSDLFSLGVVLYEMVAGKAPFQGATNADTLAAVLAQHPAPLSVCRPETPPQLAKLVLRCLKKDRDQRFSSTEDLCAELKGLTLKPGDSGAIAPQNPATAASLTLPTILVEASTGGIPRIGCNRRSSHIRLACDTSRNSLSAVRLAGNDPLDATRSRNRCGDFTRRPKRRIRAARRRRPRRLDKATRVNAR